jgi:hypothetical protein
MGLVRVDESSEVMVVDIGETGVKSGQGVYVPRVPTIGYMEFVRPLISSYREESE